MIKQGEGATTGSSSRKQGRHWCTGTTRQMNGVSETRKGARSTQNLGVEKAWALYKPELFKLVSDLSGMSITE